MELEELREKINETDNKIIKLYTQRTEIAKQIGIEKQKIGKSVNDPAREREVLYRLSNLADDNLSNDIINLYQTIFALSKAHQTEINYNEGEIHSTINTAIKNTIGNFPEKATVACQGVEGAYSQIACTKLFKLPSIMYFNTWDKVFSAVEKGLCRYGILPIENSNHGSVSNVYDLMNEHKFYIVKSIKLKIEHCLLAKKGTKLSDIKEIFTHEQAVGQCSEFLEGLNDIKVTICENTAEASKLVATSDRSDIASVSSKICSDIYNLDVIKENIQNNAFNFTRFICISKKPEIYEGANKISIMLRVENKPGTLLKVLSKFNAIGLNLTKLESRPVPDSNFEFTFYFDFEASSKDKNVLALLEELKQTTQYFNYLGSFSEV